ncbi:hypothetical protein ACP4OV_001678 [Aristida adscensionis]
MGEYLFEDIFTVRRLNPDGKKFDKVSRVEACSERFDMYMQLDVATEVYPMHVDDKFTMALAPTLSLDGTPDTGFFTQTGRKTLADKFEYVMHGKLYKISETPVPKPNAEKKSDETAPNEKPSERTVPKEKKTPEDPSAKNPKVEIYASFGGLLMMLKGDPSVASSFELDQRLFLLMRKL